MKEAFVFINVLTRLRRLLDLDILPLNAVHQRCYHTRLSVHQSSEPHWTHTAHETAEERTVVYCANANAMQRLSGNP